MEFHQENIYENTRNHTNLETGIEPDIGTKPAHQQPRNANQFTPAIRAQQTSDLATRSPGQFRTINLQPHDPFRQANHGP